MRSARLLLSALLVGGALAAPAYAAFPGADGGFAYEVLTGGVRTVAADGGHDSAILRRANAMSYSANGRKLVYEGNYGIDGVWVARADGSRRRQVLDPLATRLDGRLRYQTRTPRFSPDGKRIVFAALYEVRVPGGDDGEVESRSTIATIGVDGRGLRVLRAGASPAYRPDGDRIAYVEGNAIRTIRLDGSGRRTLLSGSRLFRDHLDYAPDGRRLAFLEYREAGTVIRVLDARTGAVATIDTPAGERIDAVVWSPSGTRLAYVSVPRVADGKRTPPSSVVTVRPDGTHRTVLFRLAFDQRRGRWAEDLAWRPLP